MAAARTGMPRPVRGAKGPVAARGTLNDIEPAEHSHQSDVEGGRRQDPHITG